MSETRICWSHGVAEVQRLGGMLGPVQFRIGDQDVSPLVVAPWADDTGAAHDALPGLMKRLRGEFPCVPFGNPAVTAGLPVGWSADGPEIGHHFHGYAAHHEWEVVEDTEDHVILGIAYPSDHPVTSLRRTIRAVDDQPQLDIELEIHVQDEVTLPVALHPIFALTEAKRCARLVIPFREGFTYPVPVEPGVSRAAPNARFASLDAVPGGDGRLSLDHLPLDGETEEIVQLVGVDGRAVLEFPDYRVGLSFDARQFPSALLWLSNRGRSHYPWNGRFLGLGIEPVAGVFDLGPTVAQGSRTPIHEADVATGVRLKPGTPFVTRYSLWGEPI